MKILIKKIYLFIAVAIFSISFTACDEDLEIWDSATIDYSGTFVYELQSEDGANTYAGFSDARKIEIFNTANNVANEIWIDDHEKLFPLKSKFFLSGDASGFASVGMEFDILTNNLPSVIIPEEKPTKLGQDTTVNRDYIRCVIEEGKILAKGATTIGGNQADSLYLKIRLMSGKVTFKSYSLPVEQRQNADKEEFSWEYVSAQHILANDEVYVVSGHRYTGFPEDEY